MTKNNYRDIIDQSWVLRRKKRFREAELLLHEHLPSFEQGSYGHNLLQANLADLLLHQGNTAEARQTALSVLERNPDQVLALTVLGMAALENNSAAEAVENLDKAYRLQPSSFRAGRLARAYELEGKTASALNVLREALNQRPNDPYLLKQHNALAEKTAVSGGEKINPHPGRADECAEEDSLAYAETMKGKLTHLAPGAAAEQLVRLLKIGKRKTNPHLYLLLGDLWRKAGNDEAALEAYKTARELDPENLLALSQLLYAYRRAGKKIEAWPLLKLLLYHRPADKTAKSSLLKDAVELGKEEEAALYFEELLAEYPQHKEFYGAIRRLKSAAEQKEENPNNDH